MQTASGKGDIRLSINPATRKKILLTLLLAGYWVLGPILAALAGLLIGIGAATVFDTAMTKYQAAHTPKSSVGPSVPYLHPAVPAAVEPSTAVFSATFSTTEPRQSITRIAAAIPASGGRVRYEVEVRVTPSAGDQ